MMPPFAGVDIAMAALTSELEYLAGPVSTHIQSAEMGNQAVNSLALISARYTVRSIDTLQQLLAYSLYILCQALDLRALQRSIAARLEEGITASISKYFSEWIDAEDQKKLAAKVFARLKKRLDETSARDLEARFLECYMVAGEYGHVRILCLERLLILLSPGHAFTARLRNRHILQPPAVRRWGRPSSQHHVLARRVGSNLPRLVSQRDARLPFCPSRRVPRQPSTGQDSTRL